MFQWKWLSWPFILFLVYVIFQFSKQEGVRNRSDLCGVENGDESTCGKTLKYAGLEKGTESKLRVALLDYVNLHRKILDPKDPTEKRFLIVDDEPEAGLGNRFQVLVSAFLYAILSKRALLVDWPEIEPFTHWNGEETIGMPHISELLETPSFDWDFSRHSLLPQFRCDNKTEFKWKDDTWFQCCNSPDPCFNTSRFRGLEESFQCGYFLGDPPDPILRVRTWDYFIPTIVSNPFYRNQLETLFPDKDFFKPLARFLLRPTLSIQKEISQLQKELFGTYTIGLQIRKVGINKLSQQKEELFFEVATLLTQQKLLEWRKEGKEAKDIRWFIASDSYSTRLRVFEHHKVSFVDVPIGRDSLEGVRYGLIDMWLLSLCDDVVVSAASTYGKVAHGLGGREPWVVPSHGEPFLREDSQPCQFQFQRHFCLSTESIPKYLLPSISQCHSS